MVHMKARKIVPTKLFFTLYKAYHFFNSQKRIPRKYVHLTESAKVSNHEISMCTQMNRILNTQFIYYNFILGGSAKGKKGSGKKGKTPEPEPEPEPQEPTGPPPPEPGSEEWTFVDLNIKDVCIHLT